ncbi:MAG: hypothetical protein ACI8W8_000835 [Rhodothermales bacterium]
MGGFDLAEQDDFGDKFIAEFVVALEAFEKVGHA